MCRSIRVLRRPADPVTPDEIAAAALQYVRKVSGYRQPSKQNQVAFDTAVQEIAAATGRLLKGVQRSAPAESVKYSRAGRSRSEWWPAPSETPRE
jgi:hypothetical protein